MPGTERFTANHTMHLCPKDRATYSLLTHKETLVPPSTGSSFHAPLENAKVVAL